jgi:ABC-type uncharacterized transport system substrate-binding protein
MEFDSQTNELRRGVAVVRGTMYNTAQLMTLKKESINLMSYTPRQVLPFFGSIILSALVLAFPSKTVAHPHAFVETFLTAVFNAEGLSGVRQRWRCDPMLTVTLLNFIKENHDGELDASEVDALRTKSFTLLRDHDYFTHVQVDGKAVRMQNATDFNAYLDNGKIVYDFFTPCRVEATDKKRTVAVASYDWTFYTYLFLCDPASDGSGIDPTADPLFVATSAPARPGDYERFKDAVGLDSAKGGINLAGDTEDYTISVGMEEVPSMAYFHGQIIPTAAVIRFKRK